jgi:hypothetical protein
LRSRVAAVLNFDDASIFLATNDQGKSPAGLPRVVHGCQLVALHVLKRRAQITDADEAVLLGNVLHCTHFQVDGGVGYVESGASVRCRLLAVATIANRRLPTIVQNAVFSV